MNDRLLLGLAGRFVCKQIFTENWLKLRKNRLNKLLMQIPVLLKTSLDLVMTERVRIIKTVNNQCACYRNTGIITGLGKVNNI